MSRVRPAPRTGATAGRLGATRSALAVNVAGMVMAAIVVGACVGQAVRGNAAVDEERSPAVVHHAALDDAFYDCLSTQARSLVRPGEPVVLEASRSDLAGFSDWVTLMKGVGSWVTFSDTPSGARVRLSVVDHVQGRPACLGTAVVARSVSHGKLLVRYGSGADVPGSGPPPPPQL